MLFSDESLELINKKREKHIDSKSVAELLLINTVNGRNILMTFA